MPSPLSLTPNEEEAGKVQAEREVAEAHKHNGTASRTVYFDFLWDSREALSGRSAYAATKRVELEKDRARKGGPEDNVIATQSAARPEFSRT